MGRYVAALWMHYNLSNTETVDGIPPNGIGHFEVRWYGRPRTRPNTLRATMIESRAGLTQRDAIVALWRWCSKNSDAEPVIREAAKAIGVKFVNTETGQEE